MSARVRFRLGIAYDGTAFKGWARQPGWRTVQGVIEDALEILFHRVPPTPTLTVAGRTDAGVHATAQVAHLDLDEGQLAILTRARNARGRTPSDLLQRRVNGILGSATDVLVTSVSEAPVGFDARFSAIWRRYEYRIADSLAFHDPLQRHRTLWHVGELDDARMQIASGGMLGLGDFAAYCKPRPEATTIRTLQEFSWRRDPDGVLVASLQADAFCHSMVRALIGAAVAVGAGRLTSDRMSGLLEVRKRGNDFVVQPAHGLTLVGVAYPDAAELATRAEQTRARREAEDARLRVDPDVAGD